MVVKIRIIDITDKVRRLTATEEIDQHPVLKAVQESGECTFLEPLALDMSVVREYDHIRLEGIVSTSVRLDCSRCLTPYEAAIRSEFTIFYTRATGGETADEEVELGERELASVQYDGDEIDLSPEISDHVLVEFPVKPLCGSGCRGLCATCGADMNNAPCTCAGTGGNIAFSALKNLKLER